ncbi:MAG: hypothetical protein V4621_04820 [Pseudomonadota bacterium]
MSKTLSMRVASSRFVLPVRALRDDIFIRYFVALMTFMVMVMTSMTLFLFALSREWTADVLTSATIELPANAVEKLPAIEKRLSGDGTIESYDIMTKDKVLDLISPWFGENAQELGNTISVPILVAFDFKPDIEPDTTALLKDLRAIVPQAQIITHYDWFAPLERLTHTFQMIGILSLGLLFLALLMAIHGAARGRVATHREALELLHLMGANDSYVLGQFQAYFLRLLYPGLVQGFAVGVLAIGVTWIWLGTIDIPLLPTMTPMAIGAVFLVLIGLAISLLGLLALAARRAVRQTLLEFTWI